MEPIGFVMMNVKVPCVQGYNEDHIAIVMDDPGMSEWPVILGTPLFTVLWRWTIWHVRLGDPLHSSEA